VKHRSTATGFLDFARNDSFRYRVRGAGVEEGRRCVFAVFFTVIVSGAFV
jgi:hypothetical protein